MRRQLTALVALVSTAMVVSFVVPLLLLVSTLAEDRGMTAAAQQADTIAILVSGMPVTSELAEAVAASTQRFPGTASVRLADGTILGDDWPGAAEDPEVTRARGGEAFSVRDAAGGRVYVPVLAGGGVSVVRVAIDDDQLRQGVPLAWASILGVGVALCLVAVWLAGRAARRLTAPLQEVAAVAHRLREGDLAARAADAGTSETVELSRALNGLAERIGHLLVAEREAVGKLAHRLRTPTTALRLEVDGLADAEAADRMRAALLVLQSGIDGVVAEARRPLREGSPLGADATAIVASRVAYWAPLAEDQGRVLVATLHRQPLPVRLSALQLADLVDVLVDNVFAHTDEGVGFSVSLTRTDDVAVLEVRDEGPGLTPRSEGTQRPVGSSGLGLEIAAHTAQAAGGQLQRPPTGVARPCFRVLLPLEL
ncbi:MAG: HAMP domain-containing sensor histidine kinase [Propionicimonas sp.]